MEDEGWRMEDGEDNTTISILYPRASDFPKVHSALSALIRGARAS
jgi:hypothetical protein